MNDDERVKRQRTNGSETEDERRPPRPVAAGVSVAALTVLRNDELTLLHALSQAHSTTDIRHQLLSTLCAAEQLYELPSPSLELQLLGRDQFSDLLDSQS